MTTRTCWRRAEVGQGSADGDRRLAADAGVDLVEDERRGPRRSPFGRLAQHQAYGQHGAGQFAARRHLGQWQRRLPGVGAEQPGDCSPARSAPTPYLEAGAGHGQPAELGLDRGGQTGRGRPSGAAEDGLGLGQSGAGRRPVAGSRAAARSSYDASSSRRLLACSAKAITSASSSPYLRRSSRNCWRLARTPASRSGSSSSASAVPRSSVAASASSTASDRRPLGELGERAPAG